MSLLLFTAEPLGNTEQEWGHVTVRQGAHMFWWLYYTTADVSNYTERPLIIWLQGEQWKHVITVSSNDA
ncbi:hypothetical protein NQ314_010169 [Rhamnusium bicolor]|uniref:Uncharacterized protein n=1 Tax=Rhamnusium bicolor TaxID=1586634 RepID=A0AAV8XSI0_9CUCU|nr:hypothetical protein NQ314_010169 [Rhamnusium bicolor]